MTRNIKTFAPGRPRRMLTAMKNPEVVFGTFEVIQWPADASLRKRLFPPEAMDHPAKAQIPLVMDLVEYLTEPGDLVMDVTSGTGTLMLAADQTYWRDHGHSTEELLKASSVWSDNRRKVVCIEIEEHFHLIQRRGLEMLRERDPAGAELVTLLHGDCREYLPSFEGLAEAVIFSPPYASMINKNASTTEYAQSRLKAGNVEAYTASEKNLGRLDTFHYNMEMAKIYRGIYRALKPGGSMCVIIKDLIRKDERVEVGRWVVVAAIRAGFQMKDHFKRDAPGGGFQQLARFRGQNTVDDEDLLIFEKVA